MIVSKGQYVNGQWHSEHSQTFSSYNPATGLVLWQGFHASIDIIKQASYHARAALSSWSLLSLEQRLEFITKFKVVIEKKRNQLAELITQETGKPLWESHTEVNSVLSKVDISVQALMQRASSQHSESMMIRSCLRYKPQGVVVVLGAFNFPAHLSNGHILPALLAGNTVLYKPSDQTPAVAEFMMECWHDSGIPAGVINCVQGDSHCGQKLLEQDINGVYFTGSYEAGIRIHQYFSKRPDVILALEMGGNNPLVIDTLNSVSAAVYHCILSTVITAGQRCTCARRVMIPRTSQGDSFLAQLIKTCKALIIGTGNQQPEPFMGPVISNERALHFLDKQNQLQILGGTSLLPMDLIKEHTGFLSPGIMDMTAVSNPPDQEIFAPFIQIYRYQDFDEAINLANHTQFGLAAGLLSDNALHYEHFFSTIRCGLVNWNRPTTGASSNLPFGGVGWSGNHRPSAFFASDYCSYPVASMEQNSVELPQVLLPGISLEIL